MQIDWNKVAHDPILAQEITNGHAARMRYSRFRSAMLGLEPTRRNRTGPPKSKVSKSKKDAKPKKDESVKSESAAESPVPREPAGSSSHKVKQEGPSKYGLETRLTPGTTPGPTPDPSPATAPYSMHTRLMTPCSDNDFNPAALVTSPGHEMLTSQTPYDFPPANCHTHDDPAWHGGGYSTFATIYNPFDGMSPASCDHQHLYHQHDHLSFINQSPEDGASQANVKHEGWDHRI